jgi:ubiquitin
MQIFVKTLTGKTITLEVESSDIIGEIKQKIDDKEDFHPKMQRIIFNNMTLEDDKNLQHYGILAEDTIHVTLKYMYGGGYHVYVAPPNSNGDWRNDIVLRPGQDLNIDGVIHELKKHNYDMEKYILFNTNKQIPVTSDDDISVRGLELRLK